MTQPKIVSTTYRYQVDQQSIAQVQAANAKVIGSLQAVRTTADADYANLVQQYAAEAAAAEAAATRTAGAYTKVEAAAARAANAIHDIGVQSQRELPEPSLSSFGLDEAGSSTAGKLRQASQAAIALPGVGFQSPLVLGLRAASIAADKTGASFLELGIAGGALAIVGVAAAIAVKDFTKSIEDSKKVLTGALSAQDNYYTALATMTTEQVEAQVATLQRARPLLKQQIDETQNALDSAFAQAQAQFGDATARALDASGKLPTAQLREQLEGLNAQFEENVQSTTRFKQGLESNVFAVNGLSDALKKMHD